MSIDFSIEYEEPDWSAPDCVRAVFTHRRGGHSKEPFDSANLGLHVGDIESDVLLNRALISEQFKLPAKPAWMTQIHSNRVIEVLHGPNEQSVIEGADGADGAYTNQSDPVLVMMVADCLPVLLTDDTGDERAVLHAGWRGLAQDVISNGFEKFNSQVTHAWVGPGIGPCHFEVGRQVREAFSLYPDAFREGRDGEHWFADLQMIARIQLETIGIKSISVSNHCTHCEGNRYFSARRDGITGRMACLIWKE